MQGEPLVVEDLLLLMLDDKWGSPAGAGTIHYTLGGAILADLVLQGRIDIDTGRMGWNGPTVVVTAEEGDPPADPLLRDAEEKIARRPQGVQTHLIELGTSQLEPVADRLVERGFVRRKSKRLLGLIPSTSWPSADSRHEADLRQKVCDVLEHDEDPDPHTAAVIALLSASGTLPSLDPAPRWSSKVFTRAKGLENGHWTAAAVGAVVAQNAASTAATNASIVADP